jgi:hypothetical protein
MDELTPEQLQEVLETLAINEEAFATYAAPQQEKLLTLLIPLHNYIIACHERKDTGWHATDIRQALTLLRDVKRRANASLRASPRSRIAVDLKMLAAYAEREIEELEDVHKEAIVHEANRPPEPTWGDLLGNLFDNLWKGVLWGAGIVAVLYVLFLIFGPTHFLPMVGNCQSNEGITDCYWRVQAEKEKLNRFEDCQRACGKGLGNEVCLEQCEYEYGKGKWQYANTYTTSTGKKFTCPQGEQGYEDRYGKPYCQ